MLLLNHRISIAHLNRPARGETACGDAFEVFRTEWHVTVLLVDGLGHGPRAAEAAQATLEETRRALTAQPDAPLERVLMSCHRALAGTRGAAVALCRFDPDHGRVLFSGVGNVAMTAWPDRKGLGISMPGVVGYRLRKTRVFETELGAGDLVAIYSDGISSRFSLRDYAKLSIEEIVARAEVDHAKDHDDVTLLVARVDPAPAAAELAGGGAETGSVGS